MSVEVGVLLTPTQMDMIANSIKKKKSLRLSFSKKQVLGTHIFNVSKEQAEHLKRTTEKGQGELNLTFEQLKRFAHKEGRELFKGKGILEDEIEEQKKEIKIKKELVKKDLAPRIKKQRFINDLIKRLEDMSKAPSLTKEQKKALEEAIEKNLVIYGFLRPGKKGSGARDAFLSICQRLGIKTELDECHLKGHNYTGPGTKIEEKITNLEELDEKFKGDFKKLTVKDLKFKDDKWKPINRVDEISAVHDVQYRIAQKIAKNTKQEIDLQNDADLIMMNKLRDMKRGNPSTQEKYEYYIVYPAILAKMEIEQNKLVRTGIAIKDNIQDVVEVAKGSKGILSGMFSIVTRSMEQMAENIGLKKTNAKMFGNLWNGLKEASVDFAKDVITDTAKIIGSKLTGKKIKEVSNEVSSELKMPENATKAEYEKKVREIRKFATEEIKEEESKEEPKEDSKKELPKDNEEIEHEEEPTPPTQEEIIKEQQLEIAENLPPQSQPTVLLTTVPPKKRQGRGLGMKVPKEYKKIHPLYSNEIEDFMNMNNVKPYDFIMRNGDRPDIQDTHYILVNIDDKNGGGTHYTSIFIKKGEATYFDPFGLPPPNEIKRWLKNNKLKLQYTSNQLQEKRSIMCGYYVSLFLFMMSKGISPYEFLHEKGFEHNDIDKNDGILKKLFGIR